MYRRIHEGLEITVPDDIHHGRTPEECIAWEQEALERRCQEVHGLSLAEHEKRERAKREPAAPDQLAQAAPAAEGGDA